MLECAFIGCGKCPGSIPGEAIWISFPITLCLFPVLAFVASNEATVPVSLAACLA